MVREMEMTPGGPAEQNHNVERAAKAVLQKTGYVALRGIKCEFHGGTLRLRGRVPTFFTKQVAQAAVAKVAGVVVIDNQLEVDWKPDRGSGPRRAGRPRAAGLHRASGSHDPS